MLAFTDINVIPSLAYINKNIKLNMPVNKRRYNLLIFFAFAIFSCFAQASDKQQNNPVYQVEVIAFKIEPSTNVLNETFPAYPALPESSNSITLSNQEQENIESPPQQALYQLLPPAKLQMNREANLIAKKPLYQVLFHYGWQQQVGKEYKVQLPAQESEQTSSHLQGTIWVEKGAYYYTNLHLDFFSEENSKQHYVLKTKQRIKPNELTYIDHPMFGLLINIKSVS